MKLSKAQNEVFEKAKNDIDFARSHTIREWAQKETGYTDDVIEDLVSRYYQYVSTPEEMREICENRIQHYIESVGKYYEDKKNGIVLTMCNSRTLKKLEEYGLIKIIEDSNGSHFGIDTVKVLNY